jgi:hypothetical protein
MGRLILSIIAGTVIIAVLSTGTDAIFHAAGIFPPPGQPFFDTNLLLLATVYRLIYQVGGCYVASMIAKEKARTAVWFMGIFGAIMWLVGTFIIGPDLAPLWYGILGAVLSIPSALIGEKLYSSRKNAAFVK